jgi:hypothetical protein
VVGSELTAFSDSTGQHVVFIDTNGQINQLYAPPGGSWVDQNLSAATNATPAAVYLPQLANTGTMHSPLTSFADAWGEHILYFDTAGRVDQLYVPWGGSWVFQPALGNAPAPDHCSGLTSFTQPTNSSGFAGPINEYVAYISGSHVRQLSAAGGWTTIDMTLNSGGPGAAYHCYY